MVFLALRWLILLVALAPFAYYLLAIYCCWDYFRATNSVESLPDFGLPPVSILKPVRGVDAQAYENFASFCQQNYSDYEIVFAVADADDPVLPLIVRLQKDFPDRSIRLVTEVPQLGPNRKLNNLAALARAARHEILVMSDSDVRVDPFYLRRIAVKFANPNVGAVTAFFRSRVEGSFAATLEALVSSTETVPNALVARKIEGKVQFAFGWTMATTKTHLKSIGGFEDMVQVHSDDFELGNRIAARGLAIELLPVPVEMIFPKENFVTYLRHELRWAIGLRSVRPAGYLGLLFTFGLPWTLLTVAFAPSAGCALGYVTVYLLLRLAQVSLIGIWGLDDSVTRKFLWLVPFRDAINFAVWIAGFFTSEIEWRGIKYKVKKGNKLVSA
jgi:ceramide glucosyltransferase